MENTALKMTTPFRTLDKEDQRWFVSEFGKRFTGIQFNRLFSAFSRLVTNNEELVEELQTRRFFEVNGIKDYTYRQLVFRIADFITRDFTWLNDNEQAAIVEKVNKVIDLFNVVLRRQAKQANKLSIIAESENLVDESELKKLFWWADIQHETKTKFIVRLRYRIDFEKKTSLYARRAYTYIPVSKNGYYDPKAVAAMLKEKLLIPQIKSAQKDLDELNQISANILNDIGNV